MTNGRQFRLVYAGLDFESWCEWESERWFDDGEGSEELAGLRMLLFLDSLKPVRENVSGLLEAVEDYGVDINLLAIEFARVSLWVETLDMTSGDEPLVRKREGCHRWKPEEFGESDPRHGWTWDHCQADAMKLLGSEEAVRKYVEGEKPDEKPNEEGEKRKQKDLFS